MSEGNGSPTPGEVWRRHKDLHDEFWRYRNEDLEPWRREMVKTQVIAEIVRGLFAVAAGALAAYLFKG